MTRILLSLTMLATVCCSLGLSAQGVPYGHAPEYDTVQPLIKTPDAITAVGVLKRNGKNYDLETKDLMTYRIACPDSDGQKYLGMQIRVEGLFIEGYDVEKYVYKNLPIEQIAPEDVIHIISSTHISRQ